MSESNNPGNSNGKNGHYRGEEPLSYFNDSLPNQPADDDDEIDLRKLLAVLLRRKWLVAGLTLLGLLGAWLYSSSQIPVYQSEGTLIITESQQRAGGTGEMQDLIATTYGVGLGSRIANELLVLQSRQLSSELADKMIEEDRMEDGRRFPLLWKEYPEDSTVVARGIAARRIRNNLEISRVEREADAVEIAFQSYSPLEARWMVDQTITSYGELSTEQNRMAASAAIRFLEQERGAIEKNLEESQEALRAFMSNTGLVQVDAQTEKVIQRISELEGHKQEVQTRLVSVNSAVEAYEQQLDRIKPGLAERYAESVAPTLERYQFRLAELETERLLFITRNPSLRENPEQEPELQKINEQITLLREEINRLASEMIGEDADQFVSFLSSSDGNIGTQIAELRNRLIELRVEQTQYAAQQQAIEERLAVENRFFDDLPDNMIELAGYHRDVQINENLFEIISSQYAEMALWEQTQFGLGRPLDYGYVPEEPVKPNTPLFLLIGLVAGGVFGVGLALAKETMNNRIDGVSKLKGKGYPVLTVIPDHEPFIQKHFGGREYTEVHGRKVSTNWLTFLQLLSPISEAYRRLHKNIIYSLPDEGFKTLLVTSSSQGEGKTTLALNLATVLAESGKRVLLLDLDLRRPRIHNKTGINRSPGLMEVLFDVPLKAAVRETGIKGLYLLPGGNEVPNPSAVMLSKKMTDLMFQLRKDYDHIVIDTAPYGIITDAAPIIRLADGVVVSVRFGQTRVQELNQALENLKQIRANVLGTVLTYYRHKSSADYHDSNGYDTYYYNYEDYEEYQNLHEEK